MRWFWIDRFEEFEVGRHAVALKNVTLAEEPLDDYAPGIPHFPHSLMIEGMAQTGGLLLSQLSEFKARIVLAKVTKAEFDTIAEPGDQLRYRATLVNIQEDGAICEGEISVNGNPLGTVELTFASLDESFGNDSFFVPGDLVRILRSLRLFEVARNEDGSSVAIPEHMLADEQRLMQLAK
ncbi:MAG TPA: beta-hydroxyacyl-ACP dehydratase [Planctomycetaceae bacterium]|nr:beta-hydroxyacyl-ACP dehydratase [Planctomycetaceae bacterium]